jgi:hypothetical protein
MKTVRQKNAKPLSEGHNNESYHFKAISVGNDNHNYYPCEFSLAPETNH